MFVFDPDIVPAGIGPDADGYAVECLGCGALRRVTRLRGRLQTGACADCGDVSWSRPGDLSDRDRSLLRPADDRPL